MSAVEAEADAELSLASSSARGAPVKADPAYGFPFWATFGANLALMTAVALLFRYADFIHHLGGSDALLGAIVGVGMVGSLLVRLAQGVGIDRYGPPRIWLVSSLVFVATCLAHLLVTRPDGVAVFALRILFSTSVAGILGASTTYVSLRAPAQRMAEVVGTLGTSGFLGMMLGSLLGDALCRGPSDAVGIQRLFLTASALGTLSLAGSLVALVNDRPRVRRRQPPPLSTLRRYHPGPITVLAIAIGVGLCWPQTFLRPFTESLGIAGIAIFFWAYSPIAILTRLATRTMPERYGVRPVLLAGMAMMIASQLVNPLIAAGWQLLLPAALLGMAHATIYPAMLAGGAAGFPVRYRGLATAMMLGLLDIGYLIGPPLSGTTLTLARAAGWPPYPVMFLAVAALLSCVTLYYVLASRSAEPRSAHPLEPHHVRVRRPRRRSRPAQSA